MRAMPKSVTFTLSVAEIDHHVGRLDVAMHHALAVRVGQRVGDAGDDAQHRRHRQQRGRLRVCAAGRARAAYSIAIQASPRSSPASRTPRCRVLQAAGRLAPRARKRWRASSSASPANSRPSAIVLIASGRAGRADRAPGSTAPIAPRPMSRSTTVGPDAPAGRARPLRRRASDGALRDRCASALGVRQHCRVGRATGTSARTNAAPDKPRDDPSSAAVCRPGRACP